ncbi:MAG: FAD-binding protein, partial [Candidatus Methanofastidiosa archaeon]|nr:FAD-binding protein [Candidatus Methanofastidiosa archaeon]
MKLIKGYPESMRESIEKVEKTREKRLKAQYKQMSLEERDDVLNKFHPDYKPEVKRTLSVGPSKGEIVPFEVADLIESYPRISEKDIDLSKIDYDVDLLIIGGGGAGTMAGIWATYEGIDPDDILMTTKLRHGDSNSIMAQGGIQAADKPNDSPEIHYL